MPLVVVSLLLACTGDGQDGAGPTDTACERTLWFVDSDSDGWGTGSATEACDLPAGWVALGGDCDDDDPAVHPEASEVCDGIDNNCDGEADPSGSIGEIVCYRDADGDTFGNGAMYTTACTCPDGYADNSSDCDDEDPLSNPAATEIWYDGVDQDCDGNDADADGDGYTWDGLGGNDCDDTDPASHPDAEELCGNGIDDNCDGEGPTCGLEASQGTADADAAVWYEAEAKVFRWLGSASDSDADGLREAITSRLAVRSKDHEELVFTLFEPVSAYDAEGTHTIDEVAVASLLVPDGYRGDSLRCTGGPCGAADHDLDGDGYVDYVTSAVPEDLFDGGATSLLSLYYGPVEGETRADVGHTVASTGLSNQLGEGVVWLPGSGRNSEAGVAIGRVHNGVAGYAPSIRLVELDHLRSETPLTEAIVVDWSDSATLSGRHLAAEDMDGDGIADLTYSNWAMGDSEPSAQVFVHLGPITTDVEAEDGDTIFNFTHELSDWMGDFGGCFSHVPMASRDATGSGTSGMAVSLGSKDDRGQPVGDQQVWLFDWRDAGTYTPSDANATLASADPILAGCPAPLDWGGDIDADGTPELVVPFVTTFPEYEDDDGLGGVVILEPPMAGTAELLEAEHVIRHEPGEILGVYSTLSGTSLDGDAYDDLLLGQWAWDPDDPYSSGYHGRALLFVGGPEGF